MAGCTAPPTAAWVTQQARQLMWKLQEGGKTRRFLLHYRDAKFAGSFDTVAAQNGAIRVRCRWRDQAVSRPHHHARIVVGFEAGRDGLADTRAARARRSRCHAFDENRSAPRAPAREKRSARHGTTEACRPRQAARQEEALQHGGDPKAGNGSMQNGRTVSASIWSASAPASSTA